MEDKDKQPPKEDGWTIFWGVVLAGLFVAL